VRKDSVETILSALNAASVRYLVAGGLAVAAHGYLRTTVDVDLILDLDASNVRKALGVLSSLGYRPRTPVPLEDFADAAKRNRWVAEKGLTVFSLHSSIHAATEIDLFASNPIDFDQAYRLALRVPLTDSIVSSFVGYDDLITMKRIAGRPQDLADIAQLEALRKEHERQQ
jgi:hypothetical protein